MRSETDADVRLGAFDWNLFQDLILHDFYLGGKNGDTLVYAQVLNIDFNNWSLLQRQLKIDAVKLKGAKVHLEISEDGILNVATLFVKENAAKTPKKSTKTEPFAWTASLGRVLLENIYFSFQDNKRKQNISVNVSELNLKLDKTDIAGKHIVVNSLMVEKPSVTFTKLDSTYRSDDTSRFHFMPENWRITWKKAAIDNGSFSYNANYKSWKNDGMDFNHLGISNINFSAGKGSLQRDSVESRIERLEAVEKSGLQLVSSKGKILVSLQEVRYSDFELKTGNSFLSSQFSLKYSRFDDFKQFLSKVSVSADLKDSKVSLRDVGYFAPGMKQFAHNTVYISGKIQGNTGSIEIKDLQAKTGKNTVISGTLYTTGFPKIQEAFLSLRVKMFKTNASDIRNFAPAFSSKIPSNFNSLGNVVFSGNLDGFVSDFVAHGEVSTDIGKAHSDLNFKYNPKNAASAYSGSLHLEQFHLGEWFNDTTLGTVSAIAKLNGTGIKLSSLNSKIEGEIDEITLKQYTYRNVQLKGLVQNKFFSGDLVSTDPNLDVDFHGSVDLRDSIPDFNFNAKVRNISLKNLHLTQTDYELRGDMNANFAGKNLDNMNGLLNVSNLSVRREDERQNIRYVTLQAEKKDNTNSEVSFAADRIEGRISGNYSFTTLPKVLKNYFYKTAYLIEDNVSLSPQNFTFDIEITDSLPLLRLIDPNLKYIGTSYLSGSLNSSKTKLNIKGYVPELVYGKYSIERLNLSGDISGNKAEAAINIDRLYVSDSLLLDTIAFNMHNENGAYIINAQLHDSRYFNRLNTDISLKPHKEQADVSFVRMDSWLGGNRWVVSPDNNIRLSKGRIDISNLVFYSGKQRVNLESFRKNNDKEAGIRVRIIETSLGDFITAFNPNMKSLSATLSGNLALENLFGKPLILADINLRDIQIAEEKIGSLAIRSALNNEKNQIELSGELKGEANEANISGTYGLAKDNQRLDLQTNIDKASLSFLNFPFFNKYVRDVSGTFNGKIHLAGTLKTLDLDGNIHINQADLIVSYLNTRYSLSNEDIVLSKDGYFDLGELQIRDFKNNVATGTGRIYHKHLKRFRLDLAVNARNAMLLNTTVKDNTVFYGQLFGTGRVVFTGTIPEVDITANARLTAGTQCFIPINPSYETNKYTFYTFADRKTDSLDNIKREQIKLKGVNLRITAEITPESTVNILLDPVSGDVLRVNGASPSLNIELLRTGEFNIRGLYEISQGKYLFTLQDIVNKPFQLNPGGTINFTGNIYKAQLNADAVYNVRTSVYDLIYDPAQVETGLSSEAEARAKIRIINRLMLKLRGVLEKPTVTFDIIPQDVDPLIRSLVENKLNIIRNTESELNKQAFGLLVMNRFLPSGSSVANSNYIGGSAINTVGEFLSSQISRYMGSFFESVGVKGLDINLNYQQYDQQNTLNSLTPDPSSDKRNEVQVALTQRFFGNRLSVSAGGNFDFGDRTTQAGTNWTTNVNGDFQVEYALTKSGNLRARAFNRGAWDNLNQRAVNKTGIGLSYRQDFDTLRELFRRRRRNREQTTQPADTPSGRPAKETVPKEEPKK